MGFFFLRELRSATTIVAPLDMPGRITGLSLTPTTVTPPPPPPPPPLTRQSRSISCTKLCARKVHCTVHVCVVCFPRSSHPCRFPVTDYHKYFFFFFFPVVMSEAVPRRARCAVSAAQKKELCCVICMHRKWVQKKRSF